MSLAPALPVPHPVAFQSLFSCPLCRIFAPCFMSCPATFQISLTCIVCIYKCKQAMPDSELFNLPGFVSSNSSVITQQRVILDFEAFPVEPCLYLEQQEEKVKKIYTYSILGITLNASSSTRRSWSV